MRLSVPVHAAAGVRELVRGLEQPGAADAVDVLAFHPLPAEARPLP